MISRLTTSLILFFYFTHFFCNLSAYYLPSVPRPVPSDPSCCYFSGAGIYFFWQLGCAQYIKETCNYKDMPMIGASAGSITATLLLSGADLKNATVKALEITKNSGVHARKTGLAGVSRSCMSHDKL
jgi:hypothetical protein